MNNKDNSRRLDKLLFSKQEAMELLGVGEKIFRTLRLSYIRVGKRKKYSKQDIELFINRNREDVVCLNPKKGKVRRTTGTTSQFPVYDLEAVRKQIALDRQQKK